jgi:hypothetical protein
MYELVVLYFIWGKKLRLTGRLSRERVAPQASVAWSSRSTVGYSVKANTKKKVVPIDNNSPSLHAAYFLVARTNTARTLNHKDWTSWTYLVGINIA